MVGDAIDGIPGAEARCPSACPCKSRGVGFRQLRQRCRRLSIQWHPDKVTVRFNPAPAELDLFQERCTVIMKGLNHILNYLNTRDAAHKAFIDEEEEDNDDNPFDPRTLLEKNFPKGMP